MQMAAWMSGSSMSRYLPMKVFIARSVLAIVGLCQRERGKKGHMPGQLSYEDVWTHPPGCNVAWPWPAPREGE